MKYLIILLLLLTSCNQNSKSTSFEVASVETGINSKFCYTITIYYQAGEPKAFYYYTDSNQFMVGDTLILTKKK